MDQAVNSKVVLMKVAGDNFTEIYSILSIHCHDTDLIRITKNQLSLAFEMVFKAIQNESKELPKQEPFLNPIYLEHN